MALTLPIFANYDQGTNQENTLLGWRDIIGLIIPKTSGVGSPQLAVITGNVRGFHYAAGEDGDCIYHIPHDYVPVSDLHLHMHWTHNGTNISGAMVVDIYATYAKGHQQANFPTQMVAQITVPSLSTVNTPSLHHRIDEIQISMLGGSASKLDTRAIEPDGLIILHYDVSTIPTITGGTGKPFILTLDVHYQSNSAATKNKVPNFYI